MDYSPSEITFDSRDLAEVHLLHHDALVVSLLIANSQVKRILVDNGSSSNIILLRTLPRMSILERQIITSAMVLVGFSGERLSSLGETVLPFYVIGVNL